MAKTNVTPPEAGKKDAKKPATADGEKKPRAPRKDYGYAKGATINLTDGEKSYKGDRARWYAYLQKSNGKTVEHFDGLSVKAEEKEKSRGWIRFFVENEACTLTAPPAEA